MEKFKMNSSNITNICRQIKEELNKEGGYHKIGVMYDVMEEKFITSSMDEIQTLEKKGYVYYCCVARNGLGKKKTIKSLKWEIFKLIDNKKK